MFFSVPPPFFRELREVLWSSCFNRRCINQSNTRSLFTWKQSFNSCCIRDDSDEIIFAIFTWLCSWSQRTPGNTAYNSRILSSEPLSYFEVRPISYTTMSEGEASSTSLYTALTSPLAKTFAESRKNIGLPRGFSLDIIQDFMMPPNEHRLRRNSESGELEKMLTYSSVS